MFPLRAWGRGRSFKGVSHKPFGQAVIIFLKLAADFSIIVIGKPQAEAWSKIVIPRIPVVETVAFRTVPHKPGSYTARILGVFLPEERPAVFFPVLL